MTTTVTLALLGFGAPGVALLLARWLAFDDTAASMRRHHEALSVLAEVSSRATHR